VFDEVYILFHFNFTLKHNRLSSTKIITKATVALKQRGDNDPKCHENKTRNLDISDMMDCVCVSLFSDRFLRITEVE
jgi:hypothetical protein